MAKRKHRGSSSGRSSRSSSSESASSGFRSEKPAFGKKRPHSSRSAGEAGPGFSQRPGSARHGKPSGQHRPAGGGPGFRRGRPDRGDRGERPNPAGSRATEALAPETSGKSGRGGTRQHWLYGLHAVQAALANPRRRRHRLLLTEEAAEALRKNINEANELGAEIVAREAIARVLPPGAVHQGAALLSDPLTDTALEDVLDQTSRAENAVVVILDQVTDPQNVGAILRSAAAFGATAVLVPDRNAPPETGALVKAASGAIEVVPLVRVVNLARAMEQLKAAGFWCAGLDAQAQQTLAAADLSGKVALVLGAEGEGLRRLTRDYCDILVRLPISERMESLNVSAAAAVALYELARKA